MPTVIIDSCLLPLAPHDGRSAARSGAGHLHRAAVGVRHARCTVPTLLTSSTNGTLQLAAASGTAAAVTGAAAAAAAAVSLACDRRIRLVHITRAIKVGAAACGSCNSKCQRHG